MTPSTSPSFCSECGRPTPPDQLARFGDRLVCPYCKEQYAQKLREGVAPAYAVSYAGFWIRVVAYLIDLVILLVVQSIVNFAIFGSMMATVNPTVVPGQNPFEVMGPMFARLGMSMLTNTAITAAYFTFFVGALAASPGKLALGLKIVRPDGTAVGYGRALGRYLAGILSGLILAIGYIMVGFDSEKRGLHDMICDTRVIKTRA
jgi:uncharacterized RDD family membrane protein YckC